MATTLANTSLPPVVPTEAADEAEAEEATDDSPPLPCLLFAIRNAFMSLEDEEFEFEVAIERRRRVPFIKALRNGFLHLQVPQFEAEIAIERQRRAKYQKSINNNKTSEVEVLADIQAKLGNQKSKMKLSRATIESDGTRKSASSNNEALTAAAMTRSPASSTCNDDRLEMMMATSRDNFSYTERIPVKVATENGQLGRWHQEDNNDNISPTTITTNNSCEALAHMETNPRTPADAAASAGGHETPTLINKKRPPSPDDEDAETESEDEETETETEGDEVEVIAGEDSSWDSTDSMNTGLGSKKGTCTSKFFVGTLLPFTTTTRGHEVNQSGNENVSLWTEDEDSCLTKIMKKYYKSPTIDWDTIAKELDRNRTAKECHERWILHLSKPRKTWTAEEDALIMRQVMGSDEQPFTRWTKLARQLPGRTGKQLRDRFTNYLNPSISHYPFSREEDLLLWAGHKELGTRWVEISVKFLNSQRSENQIKNRWNSVGFKKFVAEEFGPLAKAGSTWSTRRLGNGKGNPSSAVAPLAETDTLLNDTPPSLPPPFRRPPCRKRLSKRTNGTGKWRGFDDLTTTNGLLSDLT